MTRKMKRARFVKLEKRLLIILKEMESADGEGRIEIKVWREKSYGLSS